MKIVKWLLGTVILLILGLVGIGMLLPSTFKVSRSISISAPADKVYALIVDPRQWKQWSVWNQRDPAMRIDYSGAPSGAGAVWAWRSASQGDGRMTFTAAEPGLRLAYDLYFPDFGTTSTGDLRLTAQGGTTQVTWTMNGDMGRNPFYHWLALFADGMVGKDFEGGLANLKAVAEKP